MTNRNSSSKAIMDAGRERALHLYRSRGLRITALVLVIFLVLLGLFGFFIAPGILKSQLEKQLSAQLERPVSVGAIHINPYTLRVAVDKLHIGERDNTSPFVDVDNLVVNASWSSVFHMAPVLDELSLVHPQIHITRTGPQQFNFSDIVQRFASKPAAPNAQPTRFALSNISVHNGDIMLDDKVLNATHRIDQLEIGIPFLANLPHDTDIFVQPLLAMQVDGSPLHIQGQTKPFANSHESVISFSLDHLDLAKYLGYVPEPLPANIPSGLLSGKLELRFIDTQPNQQLQLQGQLQIDNLAVITHDNTPMLELGHGAATLADVQPLLSRYHFSTIELDQVKLHYAKLPGGKTNFDALLGKDKPPAPPAPPGTPPTDALIDTLTLQNDALDYTDRSGPKPAQIALDNLHGSIRNLSTVSAQPGTIDLSSNLAGGTLHATGNLFMSASRFNGEVNTNGIGIPPLVAMAPPMLNAEIASGTLDTDVHLQTDWSKTLALTLDNSKLAANNVALEQRGRKPLAWQSLNVELNHLDLGSSVAQLGDITLQGLKIDARRLKNGTIDLTDLVKSSPSHGKQAASPSWHWSIAHLGVDGSTFALTDPSLPAKDGRIDVKADKFSVDELSDNMHKPIKLDLAGGIGSGKFHIQGNVKPEPMDADLRIQATRLDVAPFASLVSVPLNVRLDSALLSANGRIRYRDRKPTPLMSYQGRVVLGRVRVLDKVSNDNFLSWNSLAASGMKIRMGEGAPQVDIGGLALNDFYARVIINANGRINLQDVESNPAQAPVSVTRAENGPAPPASTNTPPPAPVPAPAASSSAALASASSTATPPAQIHIGQITLANGNLNYTDNFIKPNYTANITQLAGKIGAFGTDTSDKPADVTLQGSLDNNSPVNINGTINPLTPVAFLDIKAGANDVELTHLTPYSGKYAGYPIIKGRLTMDVHYQLDQGKLNADNHIVLNQLTFGDRMEGPGISHLPVKLAVALLKDSNGNIDIHVPVSGSLSDPKFSLGGVIWQAFVNLLKRAVTSPFRLLASSIGGGQQDLGYVEFAPGSDVLDKNADDRLAKIVDMLDKKSTLKLDITGRVDPAQDENGLRTVMVDQMVQKEEADDIGTEAAKAAPVKPGTDDYNKYLAKAYKHADFKKPRDFVGLTKSQPPDVMIKLMEASVTVDQDALRHLAERRADAVRQYLHGKIDDSRVFVLAPKLDAKGIDDKGKTTRDDFGLHM
jgi:hypothetical protein